MRNQSSVTITLDDIIILTMTTTITNQTDLISYVVCWVISENFK